MATGTRWSSVRMEKKLSEAIAFASGNNIESEYKQAAQEIAQDIENKLRGSGRGGEHNAEFANQDTRVFRSASGRYNVLLGWLNPPSSAKEKGSGGKLWYQYQDAGFHLFGGSRWIDGVGAAIDRRERLVDALHDVNRRYVNDVARILNG